MKYKLAVFDMDGTILNTLNDLADSMNYILEKYEMPGRTLSEIRSFVGNGIKKLVERAVLQGTTPEQAEAMFQDFCRYYKEHCAVKTAAYEGVPELLKALRLAGCKTAVVSNKADFAVKELCEIYFKGMFDAAVGEKAGVQRKPAPDSVFCVMKELDISAKETVYIGDSEIDILTAQNAGIDSVIVTWGFRDKNFLMENGARQTADSINELKSFII